MTPKSLIDEEEDNGDKYYQLSNPQNMFTLYHDSHSMISDKGASYHQTSATNIYEMNSFTLNQRKTAKEDITVYENNIISSLKLNLLSDEETKNKSFQQILLDNVIHHFILDLDSSEKIVLKKSQDLESLICLGFDDSKPLNKQIVVLDGYVHFLGIKY